MAALTQERNTKHVAAETLGFPVKAATKIWKGSLVMSDAGYAAPGATALGKIALGTALETVDNTTGGDGAVSVPIDRAPAWFANLGADAVVAADRGKTCFIADDQTVAKTNGGGTRSPAGVILAVDSAKGVLVYPGSVDGVALASEITSREAITTDLASTANAKGAALVGIEDSAALYTGATVEAALAEKLTGLRVENVADANVIGGIEVVHRVAVADGATGDVDVTLTHKTMVTDVTVIKTAGAGGAGDTITVKNAATAISDAISINVSDQVVARAGTINDASHTIAAGGTLRVTRTKASGANVACIVIVRGLRVA